MKPRPKRSESFLDATDILGSELKDYDFGIVDIEEVQICEMGVKEFDGEIRYKSVGGFSMNVDEERTADTHVVLGSATKLEATSSVAPR
jgi:hypothetical protein